MTERITYETEGNVGIWMVADLKAAMESGELAEGEAHYREHASDPSMNGCVIDIETDGSVGSDVLDHVNDQWTQLAEETDVDRTAYVADGIARLAVANKNEADGMEAKAFEDRDAAVEWAADA